MKQGGQIGHSGIALDRVADAGDLEVAASAAFEAHHASLNAFALAALHDVDAAEECVAESFAKLVREMRRGRTPDNIGAWLYRVCGNLAVSRGRRQSVARRWLPFLVDRGMGRSAEDAVLAHETDSELIMALRQLRPDARIALLLAAQGMTVDEVAASIGRSPGATKTFICRSRVQLRDVLRVSRGFDDE
jgi:RNA polymerase sigma factor (sigma-70 family)